MSQADEDRAVAYRASMSARCAARKARLAALTGDDAARVALEENYLPLTGDFNYAVEEGCDEIGSEQLAN